MSRRCQITGAVPSLGRKIIRSGKSKKSGGIGTHVTAITKRRFFPNLQKVKVLLPNGQVKRLRVAVSVIKKGQLKLAPLRTWKKPEAKAA